MQSDHVPSPMKRREPDPAPGGSNVVNGATEAGSDRLWQDARACRPRRVWISGCTGPLRRPARRPPTGRPDVACDIPGAR